MKQFVLLVLLLVLATIGKGQILTIKSKETGDLLELVTLYNVATGFAAISNAQGQVNITAFQEAPSIEVHRLGYQSVTLRYSDLEDQGYVLLLEPSILGLDEVVVSATRWKQTSYEVPVRIIQIDPEDITLQNPQTAADLLGVSGKVFIQKSQQGGGSPMIRGFATNRLLYAVDGVRMNTAIFRGGNLQNIISLDPFAIEQTEVLFGPGSILYGSDAIGGVMSFQTLTPQFTLSDTMLIKGKAAARFASANQERTAHFDINTGWKKWSATTSISSNTYGDLRMGSHGPEQYLNLYYVQRQDGADVVIDNPDPLVQRPSGYSQLNLMQKIRYAPGEKWDLQYGFHYSETSNYGRYDRHQRTRNGLPRYAEWNYGPQKWMMNNLNATYEGQAALYDHLLIRLAQQVFEESRISRDLNKDRRERRIESVDAYSVNLDLAKHFSGMCTFYYGFESVLDKVTSTGQDEDIRIGIISPGPARYPQSSWQSHAVYASLQIRPSASITLQGGVRYNQFQLGAAFDTTFYPFPFVQAELNKGALTGNAGIVWQPSENLILSASASTAFRAPNVDDMGKVFDSEPGAVVVPNPDLGPEYAYNADLGIARVFGNTLKLDLSAYYTHLKNALVRRNYSLNGLDSILYDGELSRVQAIQNAAVARVFGIQAGMEIKLSRQFRLAADLNYQDGEEELDDGIKSPSRHAAPLFGSAKLKYRTGKLSLQMGVLYQAERSHADLAQEEQGKIEIYALDANGNTYAPEWYTLNFHGMYKLNDFWVISAGMENLTDRRYRPYSSGISGAGRNFILSLRAEF
ncbi:MAG: TonB-dependent receptor [Bacteroidetes bacterium]|nr:MAG: TonB-dependent receptor [Bacteroidota bacterium]